MGFTQFIFLNFTYYTFAHSKICLYSTLHEEFFKILNRVCKHNKNMVHNVGN